MALACVNGAAIGIINTVVVLVSKELYDECYHVDVFVMGSCLFGIGEIVGSFLAGEILYKLNNGFE